MIAKLGKGVLLAKCDIKSAFSFLLYILDDFDLWGFKFHGTGYYDQALPVGCSISCTAF